jgi:hypothetical protein
MKRFLALTVVLAAGVGVRAGVVSIVSSNGVGFVGVAVPAQSGVNLLSVPFEQCLSNGVPGVLRDLVATNGLVSHASDPALADQLIVLTAGGVYFYFWHKTGTGWETNITTLIDGSGTNSVSPEPAASFDVARGTGFWLKRPGTPPAATLFMKGQVPVESVALSLPGNTNFTLIGLGALTATNLNSVAACWPDRFDGPGNHDSDKLLVVTNANGAYMTYYYYGDESKWVDEDGGDPAITITPGMGFWYLRRKTSNLSFTPVVP